MEFVKVEGLGNDFVVVDGPVELSAGTIRSWCDRRLGIGADGVLELTRIAPDRIRMRYWNADGGEAEMCGNGLRCLVRLAVDRGLVSTRDVVVETAAGPLPARLLSDGFVRALVGRPVIDGAPFDVGGLLVHPINVGNPHGVVFVPDATTAPLGESGPMIEKDSASPTGTNVEFVSIVGNSRIDMRVWERGVGETMASGTGATAAAFAASVYRDVQSPIEVTLPGGALTIELVGAEAWMIGPANVVYRGQIDQST
jgi:diaminopimelate epimerase